MQCNADAISSRYTQPSRRPAQFAASELDVLQECDCGTCVALAQHRSAALTLRHKAHAQLLEHQNWMLHVQGGAQNVLAQMELESKMNNIKTTHCVDRSSWASDYDIRCTAIALQKDIYVLEDVHSNRGIECAKYSHIASNMSDVETNNPRILYTLCTQETALSEGEHLCIYYDGIGHFEPLMFIPQNID